MIPLIIEIIKLVAIIWLILLIAFVLEGVGTVILNHVFGGDTYDPNL